MVPAPQGSIILDLDILGFSGDTKALKNGWADGDKLNLWFDDWNYNEKVNNPTPDLVITYDGKNSKWTAGALAAGRSLRPSGKFSVMYEGSNNLSEYTPSLLFDSQSFRSHKESYAGVSVYFMPLVCVCDGINYTYADNKLSATISGWKTYTPLKVSVKGLNPEDAKSYILQAADVTTPGAEMYPDCIGGIVIDVSDYCPTFSLVVSGSSGCMGGVPDTDGVAFYYNSCNFTNADIEFRLFKKNASGKFDEAAKAPKFTGKTLVTDGKKIFGIVIENSQFE